MTFRDPVPNQNDLQEINVIEDDDGMAGLHTSKSIIDGRSTVTTPYKFEPVRINARNKSMGNKMSNWANGAGHRKKPGVGAGSIDYFNNKFHEDFLKKAHSRVGTHYNDTNWMHRKTNLYHFKSEKTQKHLR